MLYVVVKLIGCWNKYNNKMWRTKTHLSQYTTLVFCLDTRMFSSHNKK